MKLLVSITLSVPQDLKDHMDTFPEINWSAVARDAIKKKLVMLDKFQMFIKESDLTKEDALEFGKQINKKVNKKYQ